MRQGFESFCYSPTHHIKVIHRFSRHSSFLSSSKGPVARLNMYGAPQPLRTGTGRGANLPEPTSVFVALA